MIGTITNVAAVLVGTSIGAVAGSRFPGRFRETIMAALGLVTITIGFRETLATDEFPLVLGAVLLGTVIGEAMRIEHGLESFGAMLQRRFARDDGIEIDVDAPEMATPSAPRPSTASPLSHSPPSTAGVWSPRSSRSSCCRAGSRWGPVAWKGC